MEEGEAKEWLATVNGGKVVGFNWQQQRGMERLP